jgi:peptide deformylase
MSVRRPVIVHVTFKDGATGKEEIMVCRGMLARVVQHEIEHLQGKLFTDNLTGLNKQDADKFLKNMARNALPPA